MNPLKSPRAKYWPSFVQLKKKDTQNTHNSPVVQQMSWKVHGYPVIYAYIIVKFNFTITCMLKWKIDFLINNKISLTDWLIVNENIQAFWAQFKSCTTWSGSVIHSAHNSIVSKSILTFNEFCPHFQALGYSRLCALRKIEGGPVFWNCEIQGTHRRIFMKKLRFCGHPEEQDLETRGHWVQQEFSLGYDNDNVKKQLVLWAK